MKQKLTLIVIVVFIICGLIMTSPVKLSWDTLKSPYPIVKYLPYKIISLNNIKGCPDVPPTIHDMEYLSIYTDRTHGLSNVDEGARQRYKDQIRPIKEYEIQIYKWVERSLNGTFKDKNKITCAIEWLDNWSQKNALLNGKTTFQGQAVRKWTLATLSGQYLQIKNLKGLNETKKKYIEEWLERLGNEVIKNYETNPEKTSRNNNHMYWAAWSVMITGVTLNNKDFYHWGETQYKKAMAQIQKDGTLPLEVLRQGKAFNYHIFAATPLVAMAETMKINGASPYKDGQLHKFINFILDDLNNDQRYTTMITGIEQNIEGTLTSGQLAWLEIYHSRFPDKRIEPWLKKLSPMIQRRIGGNMTRLYNRGE